MQYRIINYDLLDFVALCYRIFSNFGKLFHFATVLKNRVRGKCFLINTLQNERYGKSNMVTC